MCRVLTIVTCVLAALPWRAAADDPPAAAEPPRQVVGPKQVDRVGPADPAIQIVAPEDSERPAPIDDAAADHLLVEAWWDVADRIHQGEAWKTCGDALEEAIHRYPMSASAGPCRELLHSIRLAEEREARVGTLADTAPENISVDHLIHARVNQALVQQPLYFSEGFIWDRLTQAPLHAGTDPAHRLYKRGRDIIPDLIAHIDDLAATRSVIPRREQSPRPTVLCVGDIALGMLEGISHCRFSSEGYYYSQHALQGEEKRDLTANRARQWWEATKDMSPVDAILWQIDNGHLKEPRLLIAALIDMKEFDAAIRALQPRYRVDDAITYNLAVMMLDAGSREPLDFVHEVIRAGRRLRTEMVQLIAARGNSSDFMLLADVVLTDESVAPNQRHSSAASVIVQALSNTSNPRCLPVLAAIVCGYVGPVDDDDLPLEVSQPPTHVFDAAVIMQRLTGINFGLDPANPQDRQYRALVELARWWRNDGQAIFGFEQANPHAPAGIR